MTLQFGFKDSVFEAANVKAEGRARRTPARITKNFHKVDHRRGAALLVVANTAADISDPGRQDISMSLTRQESARL